MANINIYISTHDMNLRCYHCCSVRCVVPFPSHKSPYNISKIKDIMYRDIIVIMGQISSEHRIVGYLHRPAPILNSYTVFRIMSVDFFTAEIEDTRFVS